MPHQQFLFFRGQEVPLSALALQTTSQTLYWNSHVTFRLQSINLKTFEKRKISVHILHQ